MPRGSVNLDRQGSNWQDITSGGPAIDFQFQSVTTTWTITGSPAAGIEPYKVTDGSNGCIQIEVSENNVGTATLNIEGSFDGTHWYACGYQRVDGVASPARVASSFAMTQNGRAVLQVMDPYPLTRVRPSVNAGSVNAGFYILGQ